LADLACVQPLSTGGIQRQLAKARGVTVLELNKLAETDGSIDQEIDSYLMNLPDADLVVESRMAWHFVPNTLRVYLYVTDYEAAKRIIEARRSDEDYSEISDPIKHILARRRSEVLRFKKYYNVDIDDLLNYDVVVDTTFATPDDVVKEITADGSTGIKPTCWIDPRNLIPTRGPTDLLHRLAPIESEMRGTGFRLRKPIQTLYVDHAFYIVDGHARVAAALRTGTSFVPAAIAASNDQPYRRGLTGRQYVRNTVHATLVSDWEDAVGFRFQDEIWKGRGEAENRAHPDRGRALR
jgi:cytidylate kinase